MMVNYRREYRHDWGAKSYYVQLRLDPLGRDSADILLTAMLGNAPELDPLKQMVVERTEGNPFFIEETVQSMFESGALVRNGKVSLAQPLSSIKIPREREEHSRGAHRPAIDPGKGSPANALDHRKGVSPRAGQARGRARRGGARADDIGIANGRVRLSSSRHSPTSNMSSSMR